MSSSNRHESHIEDLPSMSEELERKTFEQLERLVTQLDRGEISDAQFDASITTIWHCVSGLVGNTLTDTISAMSGRGEHSDGRVFVNGPRILVVTRQLAKGLVGVFSPDRSTTGRVYDMRDELIPSKAAKEKQDEISNKLINQGWERRI